MSPNPNVQPTPAAAQDVRLLTSAELRQVAGGPMGAPTLGDKPAGMRELTPSEVRLVSGGPGGYPGLRLPSPPDGD